MTSRKSRFLLVLRNPAHQPNLSAEQMQRNLEQGIAWIRGLKASGHYLGGEPLDDGGVVLHGSRGRQITDGPFVEGKEIVAGYVLLEAESLDQAIELSRGCPGLERSASVEVRAIDEFPPGDTPS